MLWSRSIGAALIIAGTAIGGGALALPVALSKLGLIPSIVLMAVTWFFMCASAILALKINLIVSPGANFLQIVHRTLGRAGFWIGVISFLMLFYALLAAYISGIALYIENYFFNFFPGGSHSTCCILVTAIMVGVLISGITIIDQLNKILFVLMIASFVLILLYIFQSPELHVASSITYLNTQPSIILAVLPIIYTSFGYHGCSNPVIRYVGVQHTKLLCWVFICGSFLPLLGYGIWLFASFSVLNTEQLNMLAEFGTLTILMEILTNVSKHSDWFGWIVKIFSQLAILTSLLGVALGLFDYLYSCVKTVPVLPQLMAGLATFLPPLFFSLYYPNAFIVALGYAAVPLAFIAILLPLAMMYVLKRKGHKFKGQILYHICAIFAVLVILAQLGFA